MMIALLSPTLGGGATSNWPPAGATAALDFVNGAYYAGGAVRAVTDILGDGPDTGSAGGGFDAGEITTDGMYVDNFPSTNRPNAIGPLFDDLKAGLAAGCTIEFEIDFRSDPYGSFIWLLSGTDNTFGNFVVGAFVAGDVEVDDPDDVGVEGSNSGFNSGTGIKRIAVTFARHTGGNYEFAVSTEGTAAETQTVAYPPSTDVNNITLFHDGRDSSILDDAFVRSMVLYPALDPADLPALTA